MTTQLLPPPPQPGEIVQVRQRQYLVQDVQPPPASGEATLVSLSCLDDDAQGETLEVLWEHEIDARIARASWEHLGRRDFDAPSRFAAYLHTLRWNCVTATHPRLFQSPWRAGIEVMAYQLEPLRKALRLPRVNLFIADDVGLGKTIEAGLVLREMLMRQRVRRTVVVAPPSVLIQWRDELEQRFGLTFIIYDREFVARCRRERGYGVNPWTTHSRFILSHALLRDEEYAAPLRDLLSTDENGKPRDGAEPGSLLILDEAHHAAPASSSKYAIDSQFTRAVRDIAERFEHRLFLSATPHNGLSNSFSALLEILDPQRFVRGTSVEPKLRDEVMVRRLKADLREVSGGFPVRKIIKVDIDGLPVDAPELQLARLLDEYWEAREQRFEGLPPRQRAVQGFILVNLQKRLFSSVEAFYRTLKVHRRAIERATAEPPSLATAANLELLVSQPDAEDDRAELSEEQVELEEEQAIETATVTVGGKPSNRELELVARMEELAERSRRLPDARVRWLVDWIRREMCPKLPELGATATGAPAQWLPKRVVLFTEYADTKRYLEQQMKATIGTTDQGDDRLATFHGGMPDDLREQIKRAFNMDPDKHPLRILVATDAAREGVNLQNHCADLFHVDLPWNPSRLEQRNGRIDRKLQRAPEVRCHYFVYAQREADRVLEVLAERTRVIHEELGSMPPVIEERMTRRLAQGMGPRNRSQIAELLKQDTADPKSQASASPEELEGARERQTALQKQLDELRNILDQSRRFLDLKEGQLHHVLCESLGMLGAEGLLPAPEHGAEAYRVPALDRRPGADPTWADTLDTLRAPRRQGMPLGEWRRAAPMRPVVFVVFRVLERLLLLDGDRLSYRTLDVEQIGSVYESMMGFRLERAVEMSIGIGKEHVVVGLETLLARKSGERDKHLKDVAGVDFSGKALEALKRAASVDELVAAISRRISPLTPRPVPVGGFYLQPTDERRRSGSHYTPRELTEPIVRTTLRPVLEDLGPTPKPEQILALKICDPAMGSGAFLVEVCRQLAEQLVNAYDVHGRPTEALPDEEILLYAQRQVAQHCLYGVDKNSFAVDLGKLSLWLATLAREHAFTFLDHSVRHGDSLVGLSREQIVSFHWVPEKQLSVIRTLVDAAIDNAVTLRKKIQELASSDDVHEKRRMLCDAGDALARVRLVADCIVACYFSANKPKAREENLKQKEMYVQRWLSNQESVDELIASARELRNGERVVPCFHWEIEFPEVFRDGMGGFDAFVGNPPFMGGSLVSEGLGSTYHGALLELYPKTHGKADLVGFFFRRCFELLREHGTSGLVTTKSIRQGVTRRSSIGWIVDNGGHIYAARRRYAWPGRAAVVVSTVWFMRTKTSPRWSLLDERPVKRLTRFLLCAGPDREPSTLAGNEGIVFSGVNMNGKGFVLTREERASLEQLAPKELERVFPYLGGKEIDESPILEADRYAINLDGLSQSTAAQFPVLYKRLYETVHVQRQSSSEARLRNQWWCYSRPARELYRALMTRDTVIASSRHSPYLSFGVVAARQIFSDALTLFVGPTFQLFAVLQSNVHSEWAMLLGSSIKDDPRYIPEDCLRTFPFPADWRFAPMLGAAGKAYYDFRSALMIQNNEGLTRTYTRFHDPDENDAGILKLRELRFAMDRSILDAYGWSDIHLVYEFLLDYEEEEEEGDLSGRHRKKRPWRYRWTDDVRDEVLARLLDRNSQIKRQEAHSGFSGGSSLAGGNGSKPSSRVKRAKELVENQGHLFEFEGE